MKYLIALLLIVSVVGLAAAFVLPPPPVPTTQCPPFIKYNIVTYEDGSSEWTQRNAISERLPDGEDGDVLVCKYGKLFSNGLSIPYR